MRQNPHYNCRAFWSQSFELIKIFILFYSTASNVMARHELLLEALGHVFPEEEKSYQFVSTLSWVLPVVVICAGLVDLVFVVVYMKFGHPWKDIISSERMPRSQFFVSVDSIKAQDHSLDLFNGSAENDETAL